jgi:CheY-like chemotaxis protein
LQQRARFTAVEHGGQAAVLSSRLRILVATDSMKMRGPVATWAASEGHVALAADSRGRALEIARIHRPEVLLVDVQLGQGEGIAAAIELLGVSPGAETVFVAETLDAPEVRAARDVGVSRFVQAADLAGYLAVAVAPLARLARARRTLAEAQREVERLPSWSTPAETSGGGIPLAVAERRYRESYLRATLAKGGGRRVAARLTGVPYTTFCVMLRKLGITPGDSELP